MSFIAKGLSRQSVELFGKSDIYNDLYVLYLHWGFKPHLSNDKLRTLFRPLEVLSRFSIIYCCIGYFIVAYQLRDDMEKSTRSLSFAIFLFNLLFKIYMGTVKQHVIKAAMLKLSHNLYQNDSGETDEHLALREDGGRGFLRLYTTLSRFCLLLVILRSTRNAMNEFVMLPLPFYQLQFSVYIFALDTFGLYYFSFWYLFFELVPLGILVRIRENFVILRRNILKDADTLAAMAIAIDRAKYSKTRDFAKRMVNKRAFQFLRKNIVHHQEILRIIRKLDSFYWLSSMVNIIAFGSVFIIAYFHFIMLYGIRSWYYLLVEVMYAVSSMAEISLKCFFGNQIKCASQAAAEASYSTPWTEMDPKNRKILRLFQAALQRKPKISERRVLGFHHKFLASFYQSIYSYVALVRNMTRRE